MLVSSFRCPVCNALLKPGQPVPAGKHIKCYQCKAHFAVPATTGEPMPSAAPRTAAPAPRLDRDLEPEMQTDPVSRSPRRRFRPRRSRNYSGIIVGLSLGLAFLVLLIIGISLVLYLRGGFGGLRTGEVVPSFSRHNPRVTPANFDRLEPGMTLDKLESILGRGQRLSEKELPDEVTDPNRKTLLDYHHGYGIVDWYDWPNGPQHIYVGMALSRTNRRLATVLIFEPRVEAEVIRSGNRRVKTLEEDGTE